MPSRKRTAEVARLAQLCQRVQEWGWLLAAAVTPIFINPWAGLAGGDPTQAAFIRSVTLVMAAAGFIGWLEARRAPQARQPRQRPWTDNPLLVPAGLLGALATLSTLLSVNPMVSFWGSYPWRHGLYTVGSLLLLFAIAAAGLRELEQVRRLMKAMAWGSLPVVVYALAQALGWEPIPGAKMEIGVFSTLGRSNFLGAYLVELIPITGVLAVLSPKGTPRAGYLALMVAQLAALTLSQARAAWVGFFVGALAATFLLGWRWRWRRLWLPALGAGVAGVLPGGGEPGPSGLPRAGPGALSGTAGHL